MTKYRQSDEELGRHLQEQIAFLQRSASAYDDGFEGEAKRIAVSIRVLVHDTGRSVSLLKQLDLKSVDFVDSSSPSSPGSMTPYSGLIVTAMGSDGAQYCAFLDGGFAPLRRRDFDSWWGSSVFVDSDGRPISRKDLVLAVADQDGGAHVDPALADVYADLSRRNSLGWTYSDGTRTQKMGGPERAALRQICHEVLKTLIPGYEKAPVYPLDTVVFGGMEMHVVDSLDSPPMTDRGTIRKIGRNERCPCGSGEKYKRCCGSLRS